ncbi:hypothetical protein IKD67_01620 [Candidatus Saccharibacteria bacterium]|nr:hypothetical protein [Candidatus Saccharibacteria bacterium]
MENEENRKDETRGKIILFAIGVLIGAVIASAAFLICVNTLGVNNNSGSSMQMPGGGTPPEMPGGDSQSGNIQSGGNSQSGQNQPPEKPSNNNQSSGNE